MRAHDVHDEVLVCEVEYIGKYRIKIGDEMGIRILRGDAKNLRTAVFSLLHHKMFFYCVTDSPAIDFYWR